MRETGLKIKRYAESVSVVNQNGEHVVLRAILTLFGFVAVWYVVVLGNIVSDAVALRAAEAEMRTLTTDMSTLELEYLEKLNNVDLALSYSLGFREVRAEFAVRKPLGFTLGETLGNINLAQNGI